jgi:3'-5' exoribonuclease
MDKIWVKDVKEGERVKGLFLVARKATPTAKSGKTYLSVTFHDKTGELEARAFENLEALTPVFEEKDYVEVEGPIGTFQGKPQLRIEAVTKVDPAAAGVDAAEFIWAAPPEPKKPEKEKAAAGEADEAPWKELLGLVDVVTDPHVKTLIQAFLDDEDVATRLRRAPAAKTVHHAYPGGLLEHTVSSIKLAHRLADHYPQVDRDLLVAGAFFHDLGKVRELTFERQTEYTDEGRLIGHLVMTAQWIHDKARRVGVPRDLEQHIVHTVLAHHGKLEFGSPKLPVTLEALLTHYIDELDSRVNSWLNLMGREGGTRRWTDANNVYELNIWRGQLPTAQVEKKGAAPELLTPVIYVPRSQQGAPQGGGEQRKKDRKKPQRERPAQPPRAEAPGAPAAAPAEGAAPAPAPEGAAAAPAPQNGGAPHRAERPHGERGHGERPHGERGGPGGRGGGDRPFGGGDRGPRGGPDDRKKRYMGPRLPGDKGPQPGAKKTGPGLTHNPFAALAQKIGSGEEAAGEKPAEAGAGAPETPAPADQAAAAAPPSPAPEGGGEQGGGPGPASGGEPAAQ